MDKRKHGAHHFFHASFEFQLCTYVASAWHWNFSVCLHVHRFAHIRQIGLTLFCTAFIWSCIWKLRFWQRQVRTNCKSYKTLNRLYNMKIYTGVPVHKIYILIKAHGYAMLNRYGYKCPEQFQSFFFSFGVFIRRPINRNCASCTPYVPFFSCGRCECSPLAVSIIFYKDENVVYQQQLGLERKFDSFSLKFGIRDLLFNGQKYF